MVHLDSVVADSRRYRFLGLSRCKRGGAELPNPEALTEYMIMLADVQALCMDSTTTKRKETNINARVV